MQFSPGTEGADFYHRPAGGLGEGACFCDEALVKVEQRNDGWAVEVPGDRAGAETTSWASRVCTRFGGGGVSHARAIKLASSSPSRCHEGNSRRAVFFHSVRQTLIRDAGDPVGYGHATECRSRF